MASKDPFDFLISQTKATPETVMSLEKASNPQGEKDPFDFLNNIPSLGFKGEEAKPTGPIGAFAEGVGGGILRPFTFITKPLLGYEYTPDPGIQSRTGKVAEFLGSFVGLGISFFPFRAATGIALSKGFGLAGEIAESPELYQFVKGTVAGAAQFTGEASNLEEAKENAIKGAAFGGAIEGLFLAAALRSRSGRVTWPSNRVGPLPGTSVALRPEARLRPIMTEPGFPEVDPSQLAKEIEIAPNQWKTADRMEGELKALFSPDPLENIPIADYEIIRPGAKPSAPKAIATPKVEIPEGIDNVLVDIAQEHVTTSRITRVDNPNALVSYAMKRLGSTAQVLTRASQGMKEVLIHNPYNAADALNPSQIAQWKSLGVYDGMEGVYNNKSYAFTGEVVEEGRVQLRDPKNPGRVFAPKANEVSVPVSPKYFPRSSAGMAVKRQVEQYKQAIAEGTNKIGFVIPSNEPGSARRGIIDVSGFEEHKSLNAFARKYKDELAAIPNAPTQADAFNILAMRKGIKGIIIKDSGITTDVHVFDQNSVKIVQEPPRFGLTLDNAVVSMDAATGKPLLHHIQPSWTNTAAGILRDKGFPEKEIKKFLDEQSQFFGKTLDDLMDDEFKIAKKASEGQFYEGCF